MSQPLYAVYGVSGFGREVMPLARQALRDMRVPHDRLVFIDDSPSAPSVNSHRVYRYGEFLALDASFRQVVIAIANSIDRERLAERLRGDGVHEWSVQAQNAVVMDDVVIGPGSVLSPFVTLTSNIRIGQHFQCNLYSYVAHDCVIGDFVTFAPCVRCNGNIWVDDHAYIGTGAILRQGAPGSPLRIGRGAVVGMGAVVTKDVPSGATMVGNPASELHRH